MNTESNADSASMANPETPAMFRNLRQLIAELVSRTNNQHDQATILITACIEEGMDEGKRIVGALKTLGFDPRHVGIILKTGTGDNPNRHLWRRDGTGKYSAYPDAFHGRVAASHIKFEDSPVVG